MENIIVALIGALVASLTALLPFIIELKKLKAQQKTDVENQIKKQEEQLNGFKLEITKTLEAHREEYLKGIDDVHDSIKDIKAEYNKSTSLIEQKIDYLEKKQDKHNNIIERTYALEKEIGILENRESVSEHRLTDLEKK